MSPDLTIIHVVPGGQAELDGLAQPQDRILAVDGQIAMGCQLGSLLKAGAFSYVFEVLRRAPPDNFVARITQMSLGHHKTAVYSLMKLPVRRGPNGLGVEMQGAVCRKVEDTAAEDGLLKPGDMVVEVDAKPVR